jgi:two-component sensor histidine kinase
LRAAARFEQRRGADHMTVERWQLEAVSPSNAVFDRPESQTVANYERELTAHRCTELRLRQDLARAEALLREKDEVIQQQELLSRESDHRLLNGLQMIASLLLLQSRAAANPDASSQLAVAANRVAAMGQVHRRLHYSDGAKTVAFKRYLEDFCRDFSTMLAWNERQDRAIVLEGIEVELPSDTGIPLGFIVNELITNAVKYGKGRITVALQASPERGYALSVSNGGRALPEGFDSAARAGLGLKLVRSLVGKIGGELLTGRGDQDEGARFTVLFS